MQLLVAHGDAHLTVTALHTNKSPSLRICVALTRFVIFDDVSVGDPTSERARYSAVQKCAKRRGSRGAGFTKRLHKGYTRARSFAPLHRARLSAGSTSRRRTTCESSSLRSTGGRLSSAR